MGAPCVHVFTMNQEAPVCSLVEAVVGNRRAMHQATRERERERERVFLMQQCYSDMVITHRVVVCGRLARPASTSEKTSPKRPCYYK